MRLRVQPSAGKKKGVGGLHLGSAKTLPQRDAWLALSQERYSNKVVTILKYMKSTSSLPQQVKLQIYEYINNNKIKA